MQTLRDASADRAGRGAAIRRVQHAWKTAEEVLEQRHGRRAPVDVAAIASHYARIVYRELDTDISGALVPLETKTWAIRVNDTHPPVRQRFTIAHELGHLLLHGYTAPHADRSFRFRDTRSSEGSALEEVEANQFAAELLMPRALLLKEARHHHLEHAPASLGSPRGEHQRARGYRAPRARTGPPAPESCLPAEHRGAGDHVRTGSRVLGGGEFLREGVVPQRWRLVRRASLRPEVEGLSLMSSKPWYRRSRIWCRVGRRSRVLGGCSWVGRNPEGGR